MINLNYLIVEGYCDTSEELKDYLKCLTLLPARIEEWSITPNQELRKMQFKIEYVPLFSKSEDKCENNNRFFRIGTSLE